MSVQKPHESLLNNETLFAFIAHAIGPVMMAVDLSNDGPQSFPFIILTGLIYLYFRNRSDYVKHHARQALALQILGTFGWFALVATGTAIWLVLLIVSLIAVLVLVGLLLIPMVVLSYPLFILLSLTLPASVAILGSIGAWKTANGQDFNYPILAKLLDRYFGVCYVPQDTKDSEVVLV